MEQRFGNITLGEVNEMLISFIGKDMYLSYWEKNNPKDSLDAYRKRLDRLLKEKDSDLSVLCLSDESSVSKFVFEKILPDLQKTYSLSENLCKFMKDFVCSLYDRFTHNDMPILDYCSNFDAFRIQDYLEQAKQKYNLVFDNIAVKFESLKKFYEYLGENNILNEDSARNMINAMKSRVKKTTWSNMEQLLKLKQVQDDKQIASFLIDAFIMSNIYNSLHSKVKTSSIIDPQYYAKQIINNGIKYFFVDYGYKTDESRADDILKTIEEQCHEAAVFYCNWFRGYHCVAKRELKQAKEYYKKAFAARRFAGCQFELFIKQAFALSCYLDFDADSVRKSAEDSTLKSPLPADAKKFWSYGYAAGIFTQKREDIHQILFHRVENFMLYFSTKMFLENTNFCKQLAKEKNIIKMPDYNSLNNEFEILSSLKVKDINRRVRFVATRQTKNPPIVVALFCVEVCYLSGYADLLGKFIDLINGWLAKFELDFSLCSDKGSTIACDAIQQYKNLKLRQLDLEIIELKQIVLRIIDKSNKESLTRPSLQKKRCALQEAIESCDMDILKAVVEKIKDIDNLRISADEDSPVYFTINRYMQLYRYINDTNFKPQDGNINFQNLDVPGLTKEYKIQYIKFGESNPKSLKYKLSMVQSYGSEELWDSKLVDIQNVCIYLIEQTKDQDGYFKKTKDGNLVTSLLFAAESNNVEICRNLIMHNADPNKNYPDTFLQRCIYWESWDILAMYLEEFPKQAKIGINKTDNLFHLPLLKAFLQNFKISKNYTITYFNHVVGLFKKCGAIY